MLLCFSDACHFHLVIPAEAGIHSAEITTMAKGVEYSAVEPGCSQCSIFCFGVCMPGPLDGFAFLSCAFEPSIAVQWIAAQPVLTPLAACKHTDARLCGINLLWCKP